MEHASPAWLRLHPNSAAMPLDDLLANRETHSRPVVLLPRVQALKNHEDPLEELPVDADAVVDNWRS